MDCTMFSSQDTLLNAYNLLCNTIRRNDKETACKLILDGHVPVNPIKKSYYNTPLHLAIKHFDDMGFIIMLLDEGANIYAKNQHRQTCLQMAIAYDKEDIVKLLLNRDAHIYENLESLIIQAVTKMNKNIVIVLLTHGVDTNLPLNLLGAIKIAAKKGYVNVLQFLLSYYKLDEINVPYIPIEIVMSNDLKSQEISDLLLKHGFKINAKDKQSFEFAYAAVEKKCFNIVQTILQFIININAINKDTGLALIHVACINKDAKMVKLLIDHNANMNVKVSENIQNIQQHFHLHERLLNNILPLFIAVYNFDVIITKLLLTNGADVQEPNIIIVASQRASNEVIADLLNYGANVNVTDSFGKSPLYYSIVCQRNNYDSISESLSYFSLNNDHAKVAIVQLLLEKGADPNINNPDVFPPLHTAIEKGYLNVVNTLLEYNADINHQDSRGYTPLHFAINHDPAILDLILKHNPDIDAANDEFMTPLHMAAVTDNCDALIKLLKKHANINAGDKDGNTALHLACQSCESLAIIKTLLKHNADVSAKNNNGETSLHIIALQSWAHNVSIHIRVVETLLKYNADINSMDNNRRTPLAIACEYEHENIVEVLLKHGADVQFKDLEERTPLYIAADQGNANIFNALLKEGGDINHECKNLIPLYCIKKAINRIASIVNDWNVGLDELQNVDFTAEEHIKIYKIAREHIIKLKCAKLTVNKKNLELIYTDYDLQNKVDMLVAFDFQSILSTSQIEEQCVQEIENLKCEIIGYINLYDFLSKNISELAKFCKNGRIIKALQSVHYKNKFPLYIDMIKVRFSEAVKRSELLETLKKYSLTVIFGELPSICVDYIIRYLDYDNLKIFICTVEQLNKSHRK